jgi:ADP-heptose:LPS heptosyltransferase
MRHSAFFINGGAGRVLCSIPALELYSAENPDDDFIIVCEGGMQFYKGHKALHERAFDINHKDLFKDKVKDRNCFSPEPYRVWEYYNQKASLSQAFDIAINNKGLRDVPKPQINLSADEYFGGIELIKEVKTKTSKSKTLVIQPFGRTSDFIGTIRKDNSGRSLSTSDAIAIIKQLQKAYGVILMTESPIDFEANNVKDLIATPQNITLGQWAGIISEADYFVGIDSVGQHLANALGKKATVIISATYPVNVSYPNNKGFNILDLGGDRRKYDPIRICMDEVAARNNESLMQLNDKVIDYIVQSIKTHIEK